MKRILYILLLSLFAVRALMAQDFQVRECSESEIPSSRRAKYYDEAHRIVQDFYMLLLESVGNTDNRDVVIEQLINDKQATTLKTDFLLAQDQNLSFCSPLQYFTKFEAVYKDMVEKVEFLVDNFTDGKIMMNSLVSCFIPVDYDLTLLKGEDVLFKRRCRMYCLFPKVSADKLVKVMQVEPVKDIIVAYKSVTQSENNISLIDKFVIKFKSWSIFDQILYCIMICFFVGGIIFCLIQIYAIFLDDKLRELITHINKKRQFNQLLSTAQKGDIKSMKELAQLYEYGDTSEESYDKSFEWYLKAAQKDDEESLYKVAFYYDIGKGVEMNAAKAVVYYKKAAEFNHAKAQYELGKHYQEGEGIIQSDKDAVEWFTRAAEQRNADAQYELGLCYEKGRGVPQSYEKAVEWYTKASKKNQTDAIYRLGECYYHGQGVSVDYQQAVKYYGWAGLHHHQDALYALGMCYKNGIGTQQSDEYAFRMFIHAYNHPKALYETGLCCLEGKGVKQSEKDAILYFTKAAEQGHIEAQNLLTLYNKEQTI